MMHTPLCDGLPAKVRRISARAPENPGHLDSSPVQHHRDKGHSRRHRNAAMPDSTRHDDSRDADRRGVPLSLSDRIADPNERHRSHHDSRSRHRTAWPESSPPPYHRRPDRMNDELPRAGSGKARATDSTEDLIPRFRANREKEHRRESSDKHEGARHSSRTRERERYTSPSGSTGKRARSRSRSYDRSHHKKSRRNRSSSRPPRDQDHRDSRKRRRHSPRDDWRESPRPTRRRSRSPDRSQGPEPRRTERSLSPTFGGSDSKSSGRDSRQRRVRSRERRHSHSRTRSPGSDSRHSTIPRQLSPRRESMPVASKRPSNQPQRDRGYQVQDFPAPRSPPSYASRRYREEAKEDHARPDIDEDLSSRDGYRGNYKQTYSSRPPHSSEHHRYAQSPHGPSRHNSPSRSPYSHSRNARPSQQYPTSR